MSINLERRPDDKVKECPFCGGDDIAIQNTHTASYWVVCEDCEATVCGRAYGEHLTSDKLRLRHHELAKASALKAWNRRYGEP